ncbi:MAG: thiamine phosphate synthase [Planctomycetes bacterium]|nr:thiamine phosphate synthase [Planctomycetota bacterium]
MKLPGGIVALSPGDLAPPRMSAFEHAVAQCFEAGVRCFVLREPALGDREFAALATRLRARLDPALGAWLAFHDRPHLAASLGADAVHLGGRSLRPREVRPWLEPSIAILLSVHVGDDPLEWDGAQVLVHAPVFDTFKGGARHAGRGIDALASTVRQGARAVLALGGLQPEHASLVRASGAVGMAVLSGILSRPDPAARAREYLREWNDSAAAHT